MKNVFKLLIAVFMAICFSAFTGAPPAVVFAVILIAGILIGKMPYEAYLNSFVTPVWKFYKDGDPTGGGTETEAEKLEKQELLKRMKDQAGIILDERGFNTDAINGMKTILEGWNKLTIEAIRAMADDKTGAMAILKAQGIEIEALRTQIGAAGGGGKVVSIRTQLENWRDTGSKLTLEDGTIVDQPAAKGVIQQIRAGRQVSLPALEINLRAATVPMTPSNTLNDNVYLPAAQVDYTLNDIPRYKLTFWDYLTKGRSSSPTMVWINKTNPQGAAGFIAPGELKPFVSFEIEVGSSTAKKVAAADKVALELLEDIDAFESWVKDELRYQVLLAVNTALMTSDGTDPDAPTGIQHLSVAFTQTGLETTNPNYMDAIRAVIAQMRNGKLTGDIVVFINPIDSANMDMSKATDSGVYMLPAFVTADGRTIAGATVVEDHNVPVGYFQAAFLRFYKIFIYKPMVITFGWENDDFRKNLLTYLCEMRFHQGFNEQYTGAFVYDTFANVQAAIAA